MNHLEPINRLGRGEWKRRAAVLGVVIALAPAGAAAQWVQVSRVSASDRQNAQQFGAPVALDDRTAVFGAISDRSAHGAAYVFDLSDPDRPSEVFKLTPSDSINDSWFGYSVALRSGLALIGCPRCMSGGLRTGAAYLFATGTGAELSKLAPPDGVTWSEFGRSAALDNGIALVGAFQNRDALGAVYVYDVRQPQSPALISTIIAPSGDPGERFGRAVAVENGIASIGATYAMQGGVRTGCAYIFDLRDPAHPVQLAKLVASDPEEYCLFGAEVALSDGLALVGRPPNYERNLEIGAVYVFDVSDPTAPVEAAKIVPVDGEAWDGFGRDIAVDGRRALIGSGYDSNMKGLHAGSAYLFDLSDAERPVALAKLVDSAGAAYAGFGDGVAIDAEKVVIGSPSGRDDQGNGGGVVAVIVPCRANFNADEQVDTRDLLAFLNAWAVERAYNCAIFECSSDFNGDGNIDSLDVLGFLNAWSRGC